MKPEEQALLFELWRRKQEQAEALRRSFFAFLAHVKIERDPEEEAGAGAIPFILYDFQREAVERWQRIPGGHGEITLKPRQIGFSWLVAAFAYWTAAYHQASHVALFSAGEDEVKKLVAKLAYIHDNLPESIRADGRVGTQDAAFRNASTITGFPATHKAGIGTTLKLAIFDEASYHAYLRENVGAVVPATGDFGVTLIFSTANPDLGEHGPFADLFNASKGVGVDITPNGAHIYESGESVYRAVFLPADIRPGRNAAWFAREQRKYPGDPDRYHAFYPFSIEEAFKGKAGLVYPEFSPALHVVSASPMKWADYRFRVAAIDPGGGDPSAITVFGAWLPPGEDWRCHTPTGYYDRTGTTTNDDIYAYLGPFQKAAPFDFIVVDTAGGSTLVNSLISHGFPAWPADKDFDAGRRDVRTLLKQQRWTIHESCKDQIAEFPGYRLKESVDPNGHVRYVTSTPVDHHGDFCDTLRYAVRGLTAALLAYAARQGRNEVALKVVGGTDRRTQAEIVRARIKARRKVAR